MKSIKIFLFSSLCCFMVNYVICQNVNNLEINKMMVEDPKITWNTSEYKSFSEKINIYKPKFIMENWNNISLQLSTNCRKDMRKLMDGLRNSMEWAMKIEDANGKFGNGWFWGSHYWTGSKQECNYLTSKNAITDTDIWKQKTKMRFLRDTNERTQSTQQEKYGAQHRNALVPFSLDFFKLKIILNAYFIPEVREIYLGLCLPKICSNLDVENLVLLSGQSNSQISLKIEHIHSQNDYYYFYTDFVFIIISMFTSVLLLIMIYATIYDLKLIQKLKRKKCKLQTNADLFQELLLSFSVRRNFESLFISEGKDTIASFHLLRIACVFIVIMGHAFLDFNYYSENMYYKELVEREYFTYIILENVSYVVDAFFFMSGFLSTFQYFNAILKLDENKLPKGFFKEYRQGFGMVVNRYLRLSVPYFMVMGGVKLISKWSYYNSIFEPIQADHINCENYWWRNVLYINTWYPFEEMCMLWSWYLADDAQFYVIGSLLIIIAVRHVKVAASLTILLIASSWFGTGYIAYTNDFLQNVNGPLDNFNEIYDKPWTRIGPYLIGMCIGWFVSKTNGKIKMSKITLRTGWFVAITCGSFMIFSGFRKISIPRNLGIIYTALNRSFCAFILGWVVISITAQQRRGKGLPDSSATCDIEARGGSRLSYLYALSRLGYCAYLVHPITFRSTIMLMDGPFYTTREIMMSLFVSHLVATYILAFFVAMLYEAPTVALLKVFRRRRNLQEVGEEKAVTRL